MRIVLPFVLVLLQASLMISQPFASEVVSTDWIERQLSFVPDKDGNKHLFVRRAPVRAMVFSTVANAGDEVRHLISQFAESAGVAVEFTKTNPDIVAIVNARVNDGDRPNRGLLKQLGLPSHAVDAVANTTGWAEGCGAYTFIGAGGDPTVSLALADDGLPPKKISSCMRDGIVRAFGMRVSASSSLRDEDDVLQYVKLARALRICDASLGRPHAGNENYSKVRTQYVSCAVQALRREM